MTFVCPECGWEVVDPGGPSPHECKRCRGQTGRVVYLQDRTPGHTVTVACSCGFSFAVPLSFAGTLRPCPRCGQKSPVPDALPAPVRWMTSTPKQSTVQDTKQRRQRESGTAVRKFSNYPLGVGPIRVASYGMFVVAAILAGIVVVHAAADFVAGAADKALAAMPSLVLPAILAGIGFFVRHRAYVDVWLFDQDQRLVTHVRRRQFNETIEATHPYSTIVAVQVTETQSDDFSYSVDLVLKSGRTIFISNDRRHAVELAELLGVPHRGS